ncbi:hypothetical protein PJKIFABJ_00172 [Pseudomonas phage PE09]|uniref:Uncharacterized protein n=3 Tax=Otagovirus TaxID=2560197 RepID=A0A7S8BC58_9CAUD|nr:hypothetical protein QGX21_gp077 [Pseudomonas phage phiPsa315]YP_010768282.1 hypothetical protein QGX22_gp082 [Pseudomonas phage PE09]YP_010768460.1 hypothetical protein QGX23_gp079 [Pseudomonas phage PN09]QHZ60108.1 hypothetical protein PJKIFABJ_00172 [Pseudomonas phage PE09]QNO00350.1 hypothetical protein phiPsa315_149 [Pseudomonas phage phiPsa315]QPB10573.1 hypothetical protein PN09_152 [Pseudomonas phage PN09]
MADTTAPDARQAYYAKEQIRILKLKLAAFRECLRTTTIPKRKMFLEARIEELTTALFERTGTRF